MTRLTLLALLAADHEEGCESPQQMHGYQLRQELHRRRLDRLADIPYGSIYYALRRLASARLIKEVGTSKEGNRPERTVYRITDAGVEELRRLLRDAWSQPRFAADPIDIALCFNWLFPSSEMVTLLDERLGALNAADAEMQVMEMATLASTAATREVMNDLVEHRRQLLATERAWTAYIRERVSSGTYGREAGGEVDRK